MLHERLWLSGSMFASVENQTCFGECQSLSEDMILTHVLSFYLQILTNIFLEKKSREVSRESERTRHVTSNVSRVTTYLFWP